MHASYLPRRKWLVVAILCVGTTLQTDAPLYAQDTVPAHITTPADKPLLLMPPQVTARSGTALLSRTDTRFFSAQASSCCSLWDDRSDELLDFAARKQLLGSPFLLDQAVPPQITLHRRFFGGLQYTYENADRAPVFTWSGLSFKEGFEETIGQHPPAYDVAKRAHIYNGVALGGSVVIVAGAIQMLTSTLDYGKSDEELLADDGSLQGLGTIVVGAVITGVGSYLAGRQIRQGVELFNARDEASAAARAEAAPAGDNAPPDTSGVMTEVDRIEEPSNQRKGFVIGVGIGPGLTSYTLGVDQGGAFNAVSDRQSQLGLASDFKIGYAPTNDLALYWMSKVSWFKSELDGDFLIANGFGGLGASYSLRSIMPGLFANGGIGFSSWMAPFEQEYEARTGLGLAAGVEYEFAPHLIFDVDLLWGRPSADPLTSKVRGLKFTVNYLHY